MKKFLASILTLALCLGLATGCAGKQTPAENDTESAGETGVKEIPSLKIAFSPYADADQITTATEPLEQLLQAKLLEKGYDVKDIDMTVGTSYTAVGEALSAGSTDIGFISGGNYVLFSDDCDVLLTALRYAINKDSENPADWNDGTIEENTKDMSTYYRCIILAGPSEKGQELQAKVKALAAQLTEDYADKDPIFVGVLKGVVMFYSDIVRNFDAPCELDFMWISSYAGGTSTTGQMNVLRDLTRDISGRHVVILEDIYDTGNSLDFTYRHLLTREPASLKICTLLDKPERRRPGITLKPDYVGFTIPNAFVVGYGLDYNEHYRNLPYVGVLKPEAYGISE